MKRRTHPPILQVRLSTPPTFLWTPHPGSLSCGRLASLKSSSCLGLMWESPSSCHREAIGLYTQFTNTGLQSAFKCPQHPKYRQAGRQAKISAIWGNSLIQKRDFFLNEQFKINTQPWKKRGKLESYLLIKSEFSHKLPGCCVIIRYKNINPLNMKIKYSNQLSG